MSTKTAKKQVKNKIVEFYGREILNPPPVIEEEKEIFDRIDKEWFRDNCILDIGYSMGFWPMFLSYKAGLRGWVYALEADDSNCASIMNTSADCVNGSPIAILNDSRKPDLFNLPKIDFLRIGEKGWENIQRCDTTIYKNRSRVLVKVADPKEEESITVWAQSHNYPFEVLKNDHVRYLYVQPNGIPPRV